MVYKTDRFGGICFLMSCRLLLCR